MWDFVRRLVEKDEAMMTLDLNEVTKSFLVVNDRFPRLTDG